MRFAPEFLVALLASAALAQLPGAPPPGTTVYGPPPPHILTATDHTRLNIPTFGGFGNARCDASGDLFFGDLSFSVRSPFVGRGPYLEVKADRERHQLFTLPDNLISPGYNVWTISPDGTLYVLHDDDSGNGKLVRFGSDGSVADIQKIALPKDVDIREMAVTNDGALFLSGFRITQQGYTKPEHGFAAIFSNGEMIRDLSAGTPKVNPEAIGGDVIAGDDGRFYGFDGDTVHILSQSGQQIASWKIPKPSPKAEAARIQESQGYVSVLFYIPRKSKPGWAPELVPTTTVLSAVSGEVRGIYTFAPTLTNWVLCYSQDGYTMGSVDHGMMALDEVPIQ